MAAPAAMRTHYGDFVGTTMLPALEEKFRSQFAMHPKLREVLGKVVQAKTQIYQYSEVHDMPLYSTLAEGTDYTMSKPLQGYDKTVSVLKYALGFSISQEAIEDSRFEHVSDAVSKMAKSAAYTQESNFFGLFNNGFATETTADGLSIFNAAHTTPTGTYTIRNVLSTASDLSQSTLETAIKDFESNFRGDSGIHNLIKPKFLVVPSALRLYAKELVGSELKADTNNNNLNSLKDEGLVVVSSPLLSDQDGWFLAASPEETGMRIVSRKPVETKYADEAVGWINDSVLVKSRFREVVTCMHPHGLFGTPGAV